MIKNLTNVETMEIVVNAKIPTMKFVIDENHKYFLTPFRGYAFQVSYTEDGVGDAGSSDVVGLGNLVRALDGYAYPGSRSSLYAANVSPLKACFTAFAEEAINRSGLKIPMFIEVNGETMPSHRYMESFIDICINWVKENM